MIDQVCPTLKLIVEKLEQTTVAWAVFGSMALMLQWHSYRATGY